MQSAELAKRMKSKQPPTVVDVRSSMEFRHGHIPGAIHAPTWKILFRVAPLPPDRGVELVVTCEHGPRAQLAKALLMNMFGYRNVDLLDGHMSGWRQAGRSLEK
ncbi:MAG: sulfurtransferase [Geobacteraceae bacterium GWC2_55_20]|nr:MAG: sulfurtransferase [Geobacteraceae bacterium GWC2_55_20]OGU20523.1 MAG: sulfurtransferase [Geobacteraceae bacterium GWF2_54_21]HCE68821.1 rhodanese-like domain-containing protein [Geobacter sp.]